VFAAEAYGTSAAVTTPFLDPAARAAFAQAITAIEAASGVEVVVAVRRRSAGYLHANVVVGGAVAFAGLAAILFSDHVFGLASVLVDPFVVGGLAGWVVELLPAVKRLLTPATMRDRAIARAARATFVERGVHRTRERSGLLVYVSWLEREIALVADSGLERTLIGDTRAQAERTLTAAMAAGGEAVARALERLTPALAVAIPHRDDDINELPDAIDSDLDRTARGRGR